MGPTRRRSVVDMALQHGSVLSAEAVTRAKALDRMRLGDLLFRHLTRIAAVSVLLLLSGVIVSLIIGSLPAINKFGLHFLVSVQWDAVNDEFGALGRDLRHAGHLGDRHADRRPGRAVGSRFFLTELCPPLAAPADRHRDRTAGRHPEHHLRHLGAVRVCAGPAADVQPFLIDHAGQCARSSARCSRARRIGIGMLTAGLILAIMVLPFIAVDHRATCSRRCRRCSRKPAYGSAHHLGSGLATSCCRIHGSASSAASCSASAARSARPWRSPSSSAMRTRSRPRCWRRAPPSPRPSPMSSPKRWATLYTSSLIALGLLLFVITFIVLAAAQAMLLRLERRRADVMDRRATPCATPRKTTATGLAALSLLATLRVWPGWLLILWTLLSHGFAGMSLAVFTADDAAARQSTAGCSTRSIGSVIMTLLGIVIGTPIGVLAGTYLAEYGRTLAPRARRSLHQRYAPERAVDHHRPFHLRDRRGRRMGHFSALAGALRSPCSSIPVALRTTEDMLNLVPDRHARGRRGARRCRAGASIMQHLYRAARAGIVTGVLLAVARISGETAPLLFTALNNQFWSSNLNAPMANLPVVIFQFALSPYAGLAGTRLGRRADHHGGHPGPEHYRARAARAAAGEDSRSMNVAVRHKRPRPQSCAAPTGRLRTDEDRRSATSISTTATSRRSKSINLPLYRTQVTAFIGPSGCGKSTLLRILNRMYDLYPHQRADRRGAARRRRTFCARSMDLNLLRARVGMVFQKPTPFPMSIYDNVAFGIRLYERLPRRSSTARVESALREPRSGTRSRTSCTPTAAACPAASSSGCASPAPSPCSPK